MKPLIKCERTNCYRDALYMADEHHPQDDGSVDIEHRAICEIHSKQYVPQDLSTLALWQIIEWPECRSDA